MPPPSASAISLATYCIPFTHHHTHTHPFFLDAKKEAGAEKEMWEAGKRWCKGFSWEARQEGRGADLCAYWGATFNSPSQTPADRELVPRIISHSSEKLAATPCPSTIQSARHEGQITWNRTFSFTSLHQRLGSEKSLVSPLYLTCLGPF